jgi:hypothetical protein
MAIGKKWLAILLIIGFVIIIGGYLIISPGHPKQDNSTEAQDMTASINMYNEKFVDYTTAYTMLAKQSNEMNSDSQITLDEIEDYESKLVDFIAACDAIMVQSDSAKELVDNYKDKFLLTDYNRIISEFNSKEDAMRNDMNNIVIGINMVRGVNHNSEHDQILNDLSVKLIEIRDR